jgi:hypothetical protein
MCFLQQHQHMLGKQTELANHDLHDSNKESNQTTLVHWVVAAAFWGGSYSKNRPTVVCKVAKTTARKFSLDTEKKTH